MGEYVISGIQQMGIGVPEVYSAWDWYIDFFNVNAKIFDEKAIADIMAPYMGGKERERQAILALNMQGGGGFEVWQHLSSPPTPAPFDILPGDLGISACIIKCKDVKSTYGIFTNKKAELSPLFNTDGEDFFYIRDPYKNVFKLVKGDSWFMDRKKHTGGVYGAVIGTQNIEESIRFYREILGYDIILCDKSGSFEDLNYLGSFDHKFRRVLLTHSKARQGAFSEVLSNSQIELIQALDRINIHKIYEGRMWGDMGFIQLCFDINNMSALKERCAELGFPFTIDSREKKDKFDMGEAAGNFAYNEDPSGTLIEYVETEKVPILKKLNIYLNLKKHNPKKPLPRWIVKMLRFMEKKSSKK